MTSTLTIGAGLGGICLLSTRQQKRDVVFKAAQAAGIERFVPAQPAQSTVLRDCMKSVGEMLYGRRRKQPIMTRRLASRNAFECVRVVHEPVFSRNRYEFLFSAEIENWGEVVLDLRPDGPNHSALVVNLAQAIASKRDYLPGPVVSQIAVRALRHWGALPLVESGGAWFLSGYHLEQYRTFASILRGDDNSGPRFTVTQFEIASDPDTVEHVLDLLHAEITAGVNEIMNDVAEATGGMTDRSIDVRIARANRFMAKVRQYEDLLGKPLPDLSEAIESAKQAVAVNRLLSVAI
jgi:hypothetical protein